MDARPATALISVYNKEGIVDFAMRLIKLGWKIIASGGTAKALKEAGLKVKDVAELIGGGAILGHRVVTLSREIHAGLLADPKNPEHLAEMDELGLPIIDMVVCDFYPLSEEIAKPDCTVDSVIEKTDIGGPTMVRSAAKGGKIVVCRPKEREWVLQQLELQGYVSAENCQRLRAIAEAEVARYVLDSARFHGKGQFDGFVGERVVEIPKGENGPQSPAALYSTGTNDPLALDKFKLTLGAPMGYVNWTDLDRLLQTMTHITAIFHARQQYPYIAIGVKHGNPCGVGIDASSKKPAIMKAALGDPRAMFGGWVMCNFIMTGELANLLVNTGMTGGSTQKFDGVVAAGFDEEATHILARKKDRCRLVINPDLQASLLDYSRRFRYSRGGFLTQPNYTYIPNLDSPDIKIYGERKPSYENDLRLAWAICATSNSNTVTIAGSEMLYGNGAGRQDRVGGAELALKIAVDAGHKDKLPGSVACSDSFFPFPDGPKALIDAGIGAIFSTSGSVNDEKVQRLCMDKGVTLYQLPDSEARGFFNH